MMLLVVALAVPLGWAVNRAREQREAVAAIRKAGGNAWYPWQMSAGVATKENAMSIGPPGPKWLTKALGPEYFGRVYMLEMLPRDPESIFGQIEQLNDVVIIGLDSSHITDAGLSHLSRMNQLEILSISRCKNISSFGMVHLKGLTRLKELSLWRTDVDDAGLPHLRNLVNLDHLDLAETRITDNGLKELIHFTKLKELDITSTNVTRAGVRRLSRSLPNCWIHYR